MLPTSYLKHLVIGAAAAIGALTSSSSYAFDAAKTAAEYAERTIASAPTDWQIGFQQALSPVMQDMVSFHDMLLVVITIITVFVLGLLGYACWKFSAKRNPVPSTCSHNTFIEVIWTVVPVIILVAVSVRSLQVLYHVDTVPASEITLKVTGYQWYWEYDYPEENISFVSNMLNDDQINNVRTELESIGSDAPVYRLLETDNVVVLPVNTNVRIQMTGADVIHSWAIPALGVKTDTVPGRLNETWLNIDKEGYYFGQCSELCGRLHAFMPITIKAVSAEDYQAWLKEAKQEFGALDNEASEEIPLLASAY